MSCSICELRTDVKKRCRACGSCVCSDCSNLKLRKARKPVRVCVRCYESIVREYSTISRIPQSDMDRLAPYADEVSSEDERPPVEEHNASYISSISSFLVGSWFSPSTSAPENTANKSNNPPVDGAVNPPQNTCRKHLSAPPSHPTHMPSAHTHTSDTTSTPTAAPLRHRSSLGPSPVLFTTSMPSAVLYRDSSAATAPSAADVSAHAPTHGTTAAAITSTAALSSPLARKDSATPSTRESTYQGGEAVYGQAEAAYGSEGAAYTGEDAALYQAYADAAALRTHRETQTHARVTSPSTPTLPQPGATNTNIMATSSAPPAHTHAPAPTAVSVPALTPTHSDAPVHPRARRVHPRALTIPAGAHPLAAAAPSPLSSPPPLLGTPSLVPLAPPASAPAPAHTPTIAFTPTRAHTPVLTPMPALLPPAPTTAMPTATAATILTNHYTHTPTILTNASTPTSSPSSPPFTLTFPLDSPSSPALLSPGPTTHLTAHAETHAHAQAHKQGTLQGHARTHTRARASLTRAHEAAANAIICTNTPIDNNGADIQDSVSVRAPSGHGDYTTGSSGPANKVSAVFTFESPTVCSNTHATAIAAASSGNNSSNGALSRASSHGAEEEEEEEEAETEREEIEEEEEEEEDGFVSGSYSYSYSDEEGEMRAYGDADTDTDTDVHTATETETEAEAEAEDVGATEGRTGPMADDTPPTSTRSLRRGKLTPYRGNVTPYGGGSSPCNNMGTPRANALDVHSDADHARGPDRDADADVRGSASLLAPMQYEEGENSCVDDSRDDSHHDDYRGNHGNTVYDHDDNLTTSAIITFNTALESALHDDTYFPAPPSAPVPVPAVMTTTTTTIPTNMTCPSTGVATTQHSSSSSDLDNTSGIPDVKSQTPDSSHSQPKSGSFTLPSSDAYLAYYTKYCRVHVSEKIIAIIPKCVWNSGGVFPTSTPLSSTSSLPTGSVYTETTVATWRRVRTLARALAACMAEASAAHASARAGYAGSCDLTYGPTTAATSASVSASSVAARTYRTLLRGLHTRHIMQLLSLNAGMLLLTTHQCVFIPVWLAVLHTHCSHAATAVSVSLSPSLSSSSAASATCSPPPTPSLSPLGQLVLLLRILTLLDTMRAHARAHTSCSSLSALSSLSSWASIISTAKLHTSALLRVATVPVTHNTTMKQESAHKDATILTIESAGVPYTRLACLVEAASHVEVKKMVRLVMDAVNKPLRTLHDGRDDAGDAGHRLPAFNSRDDVAFAEARAMRALTMPAADSGAGSMGVDVSPLSSLAHIEKQEILRLRAIALLPQCQNPGKSQDSRKLVFEHACYPPIPCLGRLSHHIFWHAHAIAGHTWFDLYSEYHRLGLCGQDSAFRLTEVNLSLDVCPSYPRLVAVAAEVDDATILAAAGHRTMRRWPAVCWAWPPALAHANTHTPPATRRQWPVNGAVLMRSAQPCCGLSGARCGGDEVVVRENSVANWRRGRMRGAVGAEGEGLGGSGEISATLSSQMLDLSTSLSSTLPSSLSSVSSPSSGWDMCMDAEDCLLTIVDARPRVNANAQALKGGGTESPQYYSPGHFPSTLHFMDMHNIHAARKAHAQLKALCKQAVRDAGLHNPSALLPYELPASWLHDVARTGYLDMVASALKAAAAVAQLLLRGSSVLVHCTDGWDRTPTITSLAQLMLDPYYRTLPGLVVLVEKEWLCFGHKFASRTGSGGTSGDDSERSPTFVMFLDAVQQLVRQHPQAFEYTQDVLYHIIVSVDSGHFGTFMLDNNLQRHEAGLPSSAASLWTDIHAKRHLFRNNTYVFSETPIFPKLGEVSLWCELYLRQLYSIPHTSMALRSESMLGEHIFLIPEDCLKRNDLVVGTCLSLPRDLALPAATSASACTSSEQCVSDNGKDASDDGGDDDGDVVSLIGKDTTSLLLCDSVMAAVQQRRLIVGADGHASNVDDVVSATVEHLLHLSDAITGTATGDGGTATVSLSSPASSLLLQCLARAHAYAAVSPIDTYLTARAQPHAPVRALVNKMRSGQGATMRGEQEAHEMMQNDERKDKDEDRGKSTPEEPVKEETKQLEPEVSEDADGEEVSLSDLRAVIELQQCEIARLRAEYEVLKKEIRDKAE